MTATLWMEIERTFLVIERVDRGSPSGVREVSFVLATSELAQVEVPDLDDPDDTDRALDPDLYDDDPTPPEFGPETQPIIKIDPWSSVAAGFGLPGGGSGGGSGTLPWDGGALFPDCCDEPPISVTEVTPGGLPFSDLVIYLYDGSDAILVDWIDTPLTWAHLSDSPGGEVAHSAPLMRLNSELTDWAVTRIGFRRAFTGSSIYTAEQKRGQLSISTDGGQTWSDIGPPTDYDFGTWLAESAGFLYGSWADDNADTFEGDHSEVLYSEDDGATWELMPDPPGVQPNDIEWGAATPQQLHLDDNDGDPAVIWIHIGSHSGPDPNDGSIEGSLELQMATVDGDESLHQYTDSTESGGSINFFAPFQDYVGLGAWGVDRRVIIAYRNSTLGLGATYSCIIYMDPATPNAGEVAASVDPDWCWHASEAVEAYTAGADIGRPIGLIRKWDSEVIFAGWEDGTILRSTDNGASWEEMAKFAEFSEAHAIAYDQVNDSLWAVGLDAGGDAVLHGWTTAASTGGTSVDMTYNLGEVGAISASPGRNIGHLGMIVREHGVGA